MGAVEPVSAADRSQSGSVACSEDGDRVGIEFRGHQLAGVLLGMAEPEGMKQFVCQHGASGIRGGIGVGRIVADDDGAREDLAVAVSTAADPQRVCVFDYAAVAVDAQGCVVDGDLRRAIRRLDGEWQPAGSPQ